MVAHADCLDIRMVSFFLLSGLGIGGIVNSKSENGSSPTIFFCAPLVKAAFIPTIRLNVQLDRLDMEDMLSMIQCDKDITI